MAVVTTITLMWQDDITAEQAVARTKEMAGRLAKRKLGVEAVQCVVTKGVAMETSAR